MSNANAAADVSVAWRLDDIDVNATLTRPAGAGPFPAVIFVAGSGPTDRDWNSPLLPGTNGSAALLAAALTAQGFVTLRYDKRASGPQRLENAKRLMGKISMQAHTDELAGGVRLLADRADVAAQQLFVLANSEGCIHALHYQLQATARPFSGLILAAPPARSVGAVAHEQIAAQLQAVAGGDQLLAAYDAAIADFVAERPVTLAADLPDWLRNLLAAVTSPVNLPFARELWTTDAASLLAQVSAPVLVIIGKKDIQVNWQADGALIEALAETHPNITLAYPEDANHVLKHEPRDRAQLTAAAVTASYSGADTQLDTEALTTISTWLAQHR